MDEAGRAWYARIDAEAIVAERRRMMDGGAG